MNYFPETAVGQYTKIRLNIDKLIHKCMLATPNQTPTMAKDIMNTLFSGSGVLIEDGQSKDISYSVSTNNSHTQINVVKGGNTLTLECNYSDTPGEGSIQFSVNQEVRYLLENDIEGAILEGKCFELLKSFPDRVRDVMQKTQRKEISSALQMVKPDEII